MAKCKLCHKVVAATTAAKCSICLLTYHRGCVKLPESGTITKGWFCFNCKDKITPRANRSPSPIEDVARKHLTIDLGLEIRYFKEELSALRSEVRAYRDEIAEFKSALNICNTAIEAMDVRIAKLEKKSDDNTVEEAIIDLECQINERHQDCLINEVEIAGVPELAGENLVQLTKLVSEKLGVEVDEKEIIHVERVGSTRSATVREGEPVIGTRAPRPRHIAVGFARRITSEHLLHAARKQRGLSSRDIEMPGPLFYVHINERLTPYNKLLFYLARKTGHEYMWKYIWTKKGKIFARKADGDEAARIRSMSDIPKIFVPASM